MYRNLLPDRNRTRDMGVHMGNFFSKGRGLLTLSVISAAVLVATGCDDASEQDSGTTESERVLEGVAVDGYINRGLVIFDRGDGRSDAVARLDGDGRFSRSTGDPGTDYCVDDSEYEHRCLKVTLPDGNLLRVEGGIDRFVGEPLRASLSRRIVSWEDEQAITPITSLMAQLDDGERRTFVDQRNRVSSESFSLENLSADPFDPNADLNAAQRLHMVRMGYRAHKAVEVITEELLNNDDSLKRNAVSRDVYATLGEALLENSTDELAANDIETIADSVVEGTPTSDSGLGNTVDALWDFVGSSDTAAPAGVFRQSLEADDTFSFFDTDNELEDAIKARIRAIEVFAYMARNNPTTVDFTDAEALLEDSDTSTVYDERESDFFSESVDIRALGKGCLGQNTHSCAISDNDRGPGVFSAGSEEKNLSGDDGSVTINVGSEGNIEATLNHDELDGEQQITGERINDHTVSMDVEVGGIKQPVTITERVDGYTFEFQGEEQSWGEQ